MSEFEKAVLLLRIHYSMPAWYVNDAYERASADTQRIVDGWLQTRAEDERDDS